MQFALAVVHEIVKFVGLLYIGQALVRLVSFGRSATNPVYHFLRFLTSPVERMVRVVTPATVLDRHVPLVSFLLVFWLWLVLIWVRQAQGAG